MVCSNCNTINADGVKFCGNCGAPCLPHRVCKACGYYDGKQVIQVKAAKED